MWCSQFLDPLLILFFSALVNVHLDFPLHRPVADDSTLRCWTMRLFLLLPITRALPFIFSYAPLSFFFSVHVIPVVLSAACPSVLPNFTFLLFPPGTFFSSQTKVLFGHFLPPFPFLRGRHPWFTAFSWLRPRGGSAAPEFAVFFFQFPAAGDNSGASCFFFFCPFFLVLDGRGPFSPSRVFLQKSCSLGGLVFNAPFSTPLYFT